MKTKLNTLNFFNSVLMIFLVFPVLSKATELKPGILEWYTKDIKQVLFSGSLKDDHGDFRYSADSLANYHVASPTSCGIFELAGGTNMTLETHMTEAGAKFLGWPWSRLVDAVKSARPSGQKVILFETVDEPNATSHNKITMLTSDTTELKIEYGTLDSTTVQAASMRGTSRVYIIKFSNGAPIGYERRYYPNPNHIPAPSVRWPAADPRELRTDEDGRKYYRTFTCENPVTV